MLVLSRKIEEQIVIPTLGISIEVVGLSRNQVRLGIDAPREIRVIRGELPPLSGRISRRSRRRTSPEFIANATASKYCVADAQKLQQWRDDLDEKMTVVESDLQQLRKWVADGSIARWQAGSDCLNEGWKALMKCLKSPEQSESGSSHRPRRPSARPVKRVLIIDDNDNETRLLSSYLKVKGAEVITAGNGLQGIELMRPDAQLDVVLLDMDMPEYDGNWTIQQIRNNLDTKDMSVFAVTGSAEPERQNDDRLFDRWFQKPLNPDQLVSAICSNN